MPDSINRLEDAGFVVHSKNDGTEYWRLVKACIEEGIDQNELRRASPPIREIRVRRDGVEAVLRPIVHSNPKRMVFRLETEGRVFILKRAYTKTIGLRRIFPRSMGLTYFTRVMKMVVAATSAGCRATQEYYLVAEKWLSPIRQEVWLLLQCVEGGSLGGNPDFAARREELEKTVEELLRYDLTLDDLTLHNFIDSGSAIYAIDISCRPCTVLQKAKMRLKMRRRYGLRLPAPTVTQRCIEWLLALRYRVRRALGGGDM